MFTKGIIKKGEYFDSVTLMIASRKIRETKGVIDSSIVMGTKENKAILKASGLFIDLFNKSDDTDMLISLKTESEKIANDVLKNIDSTLKSLRKKEDSIDSISVSNIDSAIKIMPDANLAIISIAGKYAAEEAMKCLKQGLHVLIFSDNVAYEDEIKLKKYGKEKGLLVMGPDCGTAIINGTPLAFANEVKKGNIGIVAASGTGLQEASSIISCLGGGISQAIGTGGRDIKKYIGGIMFIEGIKALIADDKTKVILLISKPPDDKVLSKIALSLKKSEKSVVAIFIGAQADNLKMFPAIIASNLEEAAYFAKGLSCVGDIKAAKDLLSKKYSDIIRQASNKKIKFTKTQKYLRALYSGGTFCAEAQPVFASYIKNIYSNAPICGSKKLRDSNISNKNTVVDLGEDEFTVGRPHPMIDYSLRCERIIRESKDPETAIILFDIVLGYGSNMNPVSDLKNAIIEARKTSLKINNNILFICSVTGTDEDPQNRQSVIRDLEKLGVEIFDSNYSACLYSANIIKNLEDK